MKGLSLTYLIVMLLSSAAGAQTRGSEGALHEAEIDSLFYESFKFLDMDDQVETFRLYRIADSLSRLTGYEVGLANSLHFEGWKALEQGDTLLAEERMIESIERLKAMGEPLQFFGPYSALRIFYNKTHQYERKLQYYQEQLAYFKEHGPAHNLGGAYHGIANYHALNGDLEKSIEFYTKAKDAWDQSDLIDHSAIRIVIASQYLRWGNTEKSKQILAQVNHQNTADPIVAVMSIRLLAEYAIRAGDYREALTNYLQLPLYSHYIGATNLNVNYLNIANMYLELSKTDSAKYYVDLAASGELTDQIWRANGDFEYHYYISRYYEKIGDLKTSEMHLNIALGQANREKLTPLRLKYLKALADLHSRMGNEGHAYALIMDFERLKDSIEYSIASTRIANYEREKEAQQLEEENERKQKEKDEELNKQRNLRNGFIGGFGIMVMFAIVFFVQRNRIRNEKHRSDELLLNILPEQIAEELKKNGRAEARDFKLISILFTDFKDFTEASEKLSAQDLVSEINTCFEAFDRIMAKYGIEKIKTIGDSYMAAGGLPVPTDDSVKNTVLAALEMQAFIGARSEELRARGLPFFEMRVGIHTGPVVAGIVGVKKFQYDIWGDTVNTASRMESAGEVGKVNVSQATYELLKDDPQFIFEGRGKIEAKGKGEMEMWFVAKS